MIIKKLRANFSCNLVELKEASKSGGEKVSKKFQQSLENNKERWEILFGKSFLTCSFLLEALAIKYAII